MKRIRAFTILELTVALVITAVIIAAGYYSTLLVFKLFTERTLRSQSIAGHYLLNTALNNDLEHCISATAGPDSASLRLKRTQTGDAVLYQFKNKFIVRQTSLTSDTFRLITEQFHVSYLGENVNLVNHIYLKLEFNKSDVVAVFSKRYSSAQILRHQILTHE